MAAHDRLTLRAQRFHAPADGERLQDVHRVAGDADDVGLVRSQRMIELVWMETQVEDANVVGVEAGGGADVFESQRLSDRA